MKGASMGLPHPTPLCTPHPPHKGLHNRLSQRTIHGILWHIFLITVKGVLQQCEVLFVIWWEKTGEINSETHFSQKSTEMAQKWQKQFSEMSRNMSTLTSEKGLTYGSIPSYWPLRMSNILLSSLELPQDELSATLSSPLALLTG